jgi:tellurite resistance protein TerC
LALIFAGGLFYFKGETQGYQFLTGYVIEQSLSVDNILLFVLIFRHFKVPPSLQRRVLFFGVMGALVMRLSLIFLGAEVIEHYHWVMYIFGAFLVFTGVKMLFMGDDVPDDMSEGPLVRVIKRVLPFDDSFHKDKFYVVKAGKRVFTRLFLVLVIIETSDLIFAVDSIPAIFAITNDPFIVYTSNAFAIMGLRSLFFTLSGVIDKFSYLKYGLSVVLVFIGAKMLIEPWVAISSSISLLVTLSILTASIVFSLWKKPTT